MATINGYKVIIARDYPRMKLSEKVTVTDEFRAEMDAWMLSFFGTWAIVKEGEVIADEINHTLHMTERTYQALLLAIERQSPYGGIVQRCPA